MSEEKKTEEYERVFVLWVLTKKGLDQGFIKIREKEDPFHYEMDTNKLLSCLVCEFYEHRPETEHLIDIYEIPYD